MDLLSRRPDLILGGKDNQQVTVLPSNLFAQKTVVNVEGIDAGIEEEIRKRRKEVEKEVEKKVKSKEEGWEQRVDRVIEFEG